MKHTVTLRNGVQVPALGLGTWFLGENKAARAREMESLRTGISAGMTLIDTAFAAPFTTLAERFAWSM